MHVPKSLRADGVKACDNEIRVRSRTSQTCSESNLITFENLEGRAIGNGMPQLLKPIAPNAASSESRSLGGKLIHLRIIATAKALSVNLYQRRSRLELTPIVQMVRSERIF